jgi:hypothetical protein
VFFFWDFTQMILPDIEILYNEVPKDFKHNYAEIARRLSPYVDVTTISRINHANFQRLIQRLDKLKIELLVVRLPIETTHRLGSTLSMFGERPLIWIDATGQSEASIVDTVCHESVHATVLHLERWDSLPDEKLSPDNYHAEEIIARLGANDVADRIGYNTGDERINNRQEAARLRKLLQHGAFGNKWTEYNLNHLLHQAKEAAEYLAGFDRHDVSGLNLAHELEQNAGIKP